MSIENGKELSKKIKSEAKRDLQNAYDLLKQITTDSDRVTAVRTSSGAVSSAEELAAIKVPGTNSQSERLIFCFVSPNPLGGTLVAELDENSPDQNELNLKRIKDKSPHQVTIDDLHNPSVTTTAIDQIVSGFQQNPRIVRVKAQEFKIIVDRQKVAKQKLTQ